MGKVRPEKVKKMARELVKQVVSLGGEPAEFVNENPRPAPAR